MASHLGWMKLSATSSEVAGILVADRVQQLVGSRADGAQPEPSHPAVVICGVTIEFVDACVNIILAKKHNFFLNTLYLNEVANYYSCLIDEVNLGLISARFSCLIAGFLFEVVLANFNIFIRFLLVNLGIIFIGLLHVNQLVASIVKLGGIGM